MFPNQWELNHSFLSSWAKSPSSMIAGDFRGKSMRDHQPQVSVSRTKLKWTGGGTSKPGEGATAPVVFARLIGARRCSSAGGAFLACLCFLKLRQQGKEKGNNLQALLLIFNFVFFSRRSFANCLYTVSYLPCLYARATAKSC